MTKLGRKEKEKFEKKPSEAQESETSGAKGQKVPGGKPEISDATRVVELTELLKRLQAEFENFKRRTQEERKDFSNSAKRSFLDKIIPIVDHFEMALQHECADKNYELGMKMIHGLLIDMLISESVSILNPLDEKFDPVQHEAVGTSNNKNVKDNVIVEVKQKGYMLSGKVIRSAKVIINSKTVDSSEESGDDSTND